uniref:Cap protein n=1 Tax=Chicken circovirus 3 TaxID=2735305 RepID=A0A6M8DI61_9CIRC|nr:Cap protein [Chicken circovirus 3]
MFFRKKNAKPRPRFTKRKWSKKSTNKISAPVRSYVNRVIRRNEETKFSSNQYGLTLFNSGISTSGDLVSVLPTVVVGTGQNNRIGNKIRPVRLEITGYVLFYCPSAASSSNYQDARMLGARLFCFQDKTVRSYANNTITNFNLLNLGGSSTNFSGTALNWVSPHNNEQFKFFMDKRFKVMKPFGFINNTTPTTSNAITGMDPSMFHPFKLVLTEKDLPAVLTYDQTDELAYPTNFAPYIALGYCDLTNASADTTTTALGMEFSATLYYKDA